jgi:Ser/Thr protein kinase RdoA (MazF antagonist)
VLADREGKTAIEDGCWTYEAHSVPPGLDLYGDALSWTPFRSPKHASSAGASLAHLHLAAADFTAPPRAPGPLIASFTIFAADDPSREMSRFLKLYPSLDRDLPTHGEAREAIELLAPFHADLRPLLPNLAPLWTHNDLHASNLLWSSSAEDAQATAVIDFGLSDRTNAVHDLAHAIERNIVEWLALVGHTDAENIVVHFDHLRALLAGYESVRPLSDAERQALAPMTALCHAEFALSEADYFLGVLHSPEKAAMASNGWLVGHARWFHTNAGARLLTWLRDYATNQPETGSRPC